jgi:hypothetical protein
LGSETVLWDKPCFTETHVNLEIKDEQSGNVSQSGACHHEKEHREKETSMLFFVMVISSKVVLISCRWATSRFRPIYYKPYQKQNCLVIISALRARIWNTCNCPGLVASVECN